MYRVEINGQPHGDVFKLYSRWRWVRPGAGWIETYSRGARLITVRQHIARLNRVSVPNVKFIREERKNARTA